jgi:MFS family permease
MDAAKRTAITYRYEKWRAATAGIMETAGATFLLLITVRHFEAGATAKAIVAGGASVGLMISPVVVSVVGNLGRPPSRAAAALAAFGALTLLVMAAVPLLPVYVIGSVLATTSASAMIPLLTHMFQENYPVARRGQLFSRTVMIRIAAAAGFSWIGGRVLAADIGYFRVLLVVFAGAMALASYCLSRCPTHPLTNSDGTHPFRALRHARTDKIFRLTLISWMFMGLGNLMMLPLRVEYLANPKYGLHLTADRIALLTLVIPNLARLALSPVWGWLFDRMNFFALRATLNFGFAVGIVSFFASDTTTGLILAAVVFGISNAGGDVAWSLWVTKFAPPGRVAEYMSVHTFFTGVRGVAAPFLGFYLITVLTLPTLGWIAAGLIGCSILLLLPEVKWGSRARKGPAVVEELSD